MKQLIKRLEQGLRTYHDIMLDPKLDDRGIDFEEGKQNKLREVLEILRAIGIVE